MKLEIEIIHSRMFYQCRSCLHLSRGIQIYSTTTIPNLNRRQTTKVRQAVIEVLKEAHKCFQDLITDIDSELAITPGNEFTEVLEDIRDIARESLPEVEANLRRFSRNNMRL